MLIASVVVQNAQAKEKEKVTQVLIKNVNIFDGKNEKLAKGMNVLVENNLIKSIGKKAKATVGDAEIIDNGLIPTRMESYRFDTVNHERRQDLQKHN